MIMRQVLKVAASSSQRCLLKHFASYASASSKTLNNTASAGSLFHFTHAITRGVPRSFAEHSLKTNPALQIEYDHAVQQMKKYVDILERCGLQVISLPADESLPDCVFVEDSALVIGQKACLTQPGHPNRRGEVKIVGETLKSLGIETQELDDASALLDGGDIIFTGQEILVGESSRSNKAGAQSLQRAFPEFPVTSIPIHHSLHLKSVATLAQERVLLISSSKAGQEILKAVQSKGQGQYTFLQVLGDKSANVLYVNGHAIIKPASEIGSLDYQTLTSRLTVPVIETAFDEFYKADGCLSCCSILVQAPQKSS